MHLLSNNNKNIFSIFILKKIPRFFSFKRKNKSVIFNSSSFVFLFFPPCLPKKKEMIEKNQNYDEIKRVIEKGFFDLRILLSIVIIFLGFIAFFLFDIMILYAINMNNHKTGIYHELEQTIYILGQIQSSLNHYTRIENILHQNVTCI